MQLAPPSHRRNAVGRLQRADQYRGCGAILFAYEVHTPVDAVGAIDVGKSGWAEHHHVPWRRPAMRMRRRFGVMIGLHLDDNAANPVKQQSRADEIRRHLKYVARKKRSPERFTKSRRIRAVE